MIVLPPWSPDDDIRAAHAKAMDGILVRKPEAPFIIPFTAAPKPDPLPRGPIEPIPYSRPPSRKKTGYQKPEDHNNWQANQAAAVRKEKAKKKATAEMKKKARRRG